MYVFVFMDHVFVLHDTKEVKEFLDTLFRFSANGRLLYISLASSLLEWLGREGIENLPTPVPGVDMVDAISQSLKEMQKLYGVIYDPEQKCFTVSV